MGAWYRTRLLSVDAADGVIVAGAGNTVKQKYGSVVEEHEIQMMLGIARWDGEEQEGGRRGVLYGLVDMGQAEGDTTC